MADGLPYDQSPLYDAEQPYLNRDPRFYTTVLYPGARFQNDDVTEMTYAHTGYALRKYSVFDETTGNPPANVSDIKDRKSTRLNSSHVAISYAVFCLKKKNTPTTM